MLNKVTLIGRLGKDPDQKEKFTKLLLATTRKYKGDETTEWHNIVTFGKTAEVCGQYLEKGRLIAVEGRIQTRKYEASDGTTRYNTEIIADGVTFLGGGQKRAGSDSDFP